MNGAATIDGMSVSGNFGTLSAVTDGSGGAIVTACYREGTRIATDHGDIPIEALKLGDMARTAAGSSRPIVWLGSRTLPLARHPRPHDVMPVRVQAAAFGPGHPVRDLWLSPDHAVHSDGVLIPVRYLLNGASIVQEAADKVTWWHVELDAHDIVLAEGLPAESYLDTGNRGAFDVGGAITLHPGLAPDSARDAALAVWDQGACAPLATEGDVVRGRPRAAPRSAALARPRHDLRPGRPRLAEGAPLDIEEDGDWIGVKVPDEVDTLRLVSAPRARRRATSPATTGAASASP